MLHKSSFLVTVVSVASLIAAGFGGSPSTAVDAPRGPATPSAQSTQPAVAKSGVLKVRIAGLPDGVRPLGTIQGKGVRLRVTAARAKFKGLKPGRYTLTLKRVTAKVIMGGRQRGMSALPGTRRVTVKVKAGKAALVKGTYAALVARNAVKAPGTLKVVAGENTSPTAVLVKNRDNYERGGYLTSGPTTRLPNGLAAKIVKVSKRGSRVLLKLRPVEVFEIVPMFNGFGSPTTPKSSRGDSKVKSALRRLGDNFSCSVPIPDSSSYVDAELMDFSWSVITAPVYVKAETRITAVLGAAAIPAGAGVSCSLSGDITYRFGVPVGALVVPAFGGGEIVGSLEVTNAGGAVGEFKVGATADVGFDTRLEDTLYATPVEPVPDSGVSPSLAIAGRVQPSVFFGFGEPEVASLKYGIGPAVTLNAFADTCSAALTLEDSLTVELLGGLLTKELYGKAENLFTYQPGGCKPSDPIVGQWYSGDIGVWEITQTGPTSFTATVIEDILSGDCVRLPAGTTRSIEKTATGYQSQLRQYDWDCQVVATDLDAELSVEGNSLLWCGTQNVFGCLSYTRVGFDEE